MSNFLIITKTLNTLVLHLEWLLKFSKTNIKKNRNENLKKQFWAFHHGFYLETIKVCGIQNENIQEYLSDKSYEKLHPINKEFSKIIDNKLFLPFLLKDSPEIVPKYYYLIDYGRLINLNPDILNEQDLIDLCKKMNSLALKPCSSSSGDGFYRLEWKNNSFFLNNNIITESELGSFIKSLNNYIVTEYVVQNKYAAEINKSSVNTIRIICVRDSITNKFFIPISFHRFGVEGKFVDNIGAGEGGIASCIDIMTGKIKNISCIKENGQLNRSTKVIKHPDSKKQITDIIIPNWRPMINKVLEVMNHLSFLKYVGLDIVITDNGFKVIEINSLPTLMGLQLEKGILKDERLKRFFLGN